MGVKDENGNDILIKLDAAQVFITQKVFDAGWRAGFIVGKEHRCQDKQIGWFLGGLLLGCGFGLLVYLLGVRLA